MKRTLVIAITIIFILLAGCSFWKQGPEKVVLIPLDSRPCNTQYPEILGRMVNKQIKIPYAFLDNFLEPAKIEELWLWLESNSKEADKIIITTNQLINGSLIASRDPQSYKDMEKRLAKLEAFCRKNKNKEITVITILPRLLPSQFTHLWGYQEPLIEYAQLIDRADLEGRQPPSVPAELPENIWKEYLSIYENTQQLAKRLISLTDEGLIDHYLIGQDDGEKYGLSNKLVRELKPAFNEKVWFVQGADELTMLTLSRSLNFKNGLTYALGYSNEEFKEVYFPFEAAPLEEVINTKVNYLNFPLEKESEINFVIHTDPKNSSVLERMIREKETNYLGIIDIAYTNRGDIELLDFLFDPKIWPKVKGYAGWNTAGNSIGTELSHAAAYQYLKENYGRYSKNAQVDALQAYLEFKYIRMAEDLIYQGILRQELIERLTQLNIDPHNIDGSQYATANEILAQLFLPYEEELKKVFLGEYRIGEIEFRVEDISAQIQLPWRRTFEAKVTPNVSIEIRP